MTRSTETAAIAWGCGQA